MTEQPITQQSMTQQSVLPKHWLILPAAGVGARMQADRPKQYLTLLGKTVIEHTLDQLLAYPLFEKIILVISDSDPYWAQISQARGYHQHAKLHIAYGGQERCHSVLNGLAALAEDAQSEDWVAVHDVARPCIQHDDLDRLYADLGDEGAILASPVRDTMKRGRSQHGATEIIATVEREQLWHALTPQVFQYQRLHDSLQQALASGFEVTDEASAIEFSGSNPRLVEGRSDNIKVTRPEDMALAELFLAAQGCADDATNTQDQRTNRRTNDENRPRF